MTFTDTGPALDFRRYAPDPGCPAVWHYTDGAAPGELAMLAGLAAAHARQIRRCGREACAVIWRRIAWRTSNFCHHVLHSLPAAWTVAGIGGGFGIAFPVILYLARNFQ